MKRLASLPGVKNESLISPNFMYTPTPLQPFRWGQGLEKQWRDDAGRVW